MSLQKSITITKDMEFEKCGEIMVAPKHNIFALSCKYCGQQFIQFQGFMRHLQLKHSDQVKFGEKQKNLEIYAVEELLTTLNQSSMPEEGEENEEDECGDNQSEESGMVEDEANWLSEEDKTCLEVADTDADRVEKKKDEKKKGKSLMANMSILKALEDCDVSFNNMYNMDLTKCEEDKENSDDEMEEEEEDDDLNKTLLQQIQDDWGSSVEEENPNKSKGSNNQDDKLGEEEENPNKSKDSNNEDEELEDCSFMSSTQNEENLFSKSVGLKSLLEGLEDLDDVDSLLENLEDSMIVEHKENKKTTLLNTSIENKNCEKFVKPNNKCIKKSETPVLEDMDLTLNHQSLEKESNGNYNLTLMDKKGLDNDRNSETMQQKMILNIKTGEFELAIAEDSSDEEEIFNKTGEFELAITDDSSEEEEIFYKSIKTSEAVNESKGSDNEKNIGNTSKTKHQKMILNIKTGEFESVATEDSSEVKELLNKSIITSQDNDDNSMMDGNPDDSFMAQLESQLNAQIEEDEEDKDKQIDPETKRTDDFDLQLKNLELSLDEDNLESSKNELEKSKSDNFLDEDAFIKTSCKTEELKNLKITSKANKTNKLNDDLTKALEDALEEDDVNMLNMYDEEENETPLNQNLKDLLALELLEDDIDAEENPSETIINSEMEENIATDETENSTTSPKIEKIENELPLNQNLKDLLALELMEEDEIDTEENPKDTIINSEIEQNIAIDKTENSTTSPKIEKVENEPALNQNLKDLLALELMEEEDEIYTEENPKDTIINSEMEQNIAIDKTENSTGPKIMEEEDEIDTEDNPEEIIINSEMEQNIAIDTIENSTSPKIENEPPLNQNLKDLLALELMEEEDEIDTEENPKETIINSEMEENNAIDKTKNSTTSPKLEKTENVSIMSKNSNKSIEANTKDKEITQMAKEQLKETSQTPSRYVETNIKSNSPKNEQNSLNCQNVTLKNHKTKDVIKAQTLTKSKDNQGNLLTNKRKTPLKEIRENICSKLRKTPKRDKQDAITPDLIKKMKQDKFTPFINTERGDRTALQTDDILLNQSPTSQGKHEDFLENITPNSETSPKTRERKFLKQTPKTQEKNEQQNEQLHHKTPTTRGHKTPITRKHIAMKKSPETLEKTEEQINSNLAKTPRRTTRKRSFSLEISPLQENKSPETQEKTEEQTNSKLAKTPRRTSRKICEKRPFSLQISPIQENETKLRKTSPSSPAKNSKKPEIPQMIRNVTVRLPRLTPVKIKEVNLNISKSPPQISPKHITNVKLPSVSPVKIKEANLNISKSPTQKSPLKPQKMDNFITSINSETTTASLIISKSPPQISPLKQQKMDNFIKSINSETTTTTNFVNNIKLPKGITMTKISPCEIPKTSPYKSALDETPIKPRYCKQNFFESSLVEVKPTEENINNVTTLIQPQERSNNSLPKRTTSKLRERKASIRIVNKSNDMTAKITPKHNKLDYKSSPVLRSGRKKQALQRMRHVKKQIFKSLENGEHVTKMINRNVPIKVQKKKPINKINDIQILQKLKKEQMTPLLNASDNFKNPITIPPPTSPVVISPKHDEKQAKKPLHCDTSPINDDGKVGKTSLKRRANSPLLCEEQQVKRLHTSTLVSEAYVAELQQNLEKKKMGVSESVVDYLQSDLKANRLNVDNLLDEELPKDDNSPSETSNKSNGKETTSEDSEIDNNCNNNILDDLLEQVDMEQKSGVNNDSKANRLNLDNLLGEELPEDDNSPNETSNESNGKETTSEDSEIDNNCNNNILDDLLDQVDMEQKSGVNNISIKKDPDDMFIDFDENKDLNLLNNFGLNVIKSPNIEDSLSVEEVKEMHEKARTFADNYRTWQKIWSTKNSENPDLRPELDFSFKEFLKHINQIYNLELTMIDIRRVVNLISMWYVQIYHGKLIEKRQISDATGLYLVIFNYIPKNTKRFYYCEFCEEYFNTVNKYQMHRIEHTGAAYPYECSKCFKGFKIEKIYRTHAQKCTEKVTECPQNEEEIINHNLKSNKIRETAVTVDSFKCHVCTLDFETSKELFDHSKTHVKTVYNCVKCQLAFSSAAEVKTHMATCNRNIKNLPKQSTPRPQRSRVETNPKK